MADMDAALKEMMDIDGAIGVALVDHTSGMALGMVGGGKELDLTVAAAGNTDVYNASEPYSNLPYTVNVNGKDLQPWVIPYYQSSSCAVRSAVVCYNIAHKFVFDAKLLKEGENAFVLSLPYGGANYESALLP